MKSETQVSAEAADAAVTVLRSYLAGTFPERGNMTAVAEFVNALEWGNRLVIDDREPTPPEGSCPSCETPEGETHGQDCEARAFEAGVDLARKAPF